MTQLEKQDVEEIISDFEWENVLGKTTLITGATGALARYIVHALMYLFHKTGDKEGKIVILCRNMQKAEKVFKEYLTDDQFVIIKGTVEQNLVYEGKIDYIFHAGGLSATKYFSTNPVQILSANAVGTYNLLCLAKEKKVLGFLFFSSCAVNGVLKSDYYSYTGVDPVQSTNCYILGKQIGENLCASFYDEYGVPAKIVRIGYTYGPYVDLNDGHMYSDFIRAIVRREDLTIRGDGQNYLGCCYVTDAVRAFFKIMLQGTPKIPYVMRNQSEVRTIEEIAELLTVEVFAERKLKYHCCVKEKEKKEKKVIKPELLMEMGWYPKISMAEGFKRAVDIIEANGYCEENI